MGRFAEDTTVPAAKSRAELEALLERHGAHQIAIAVDREQKRAVVVFGIDGRRVRLQINTDPGNKRGRAYRPDQFERSAWRRLLLVVKAKLEIVKDGESTVEREFLADVMLPDGSTVHETLGPQLDQSYRTGAMPPMLPGIGETS
ncbi:MAG TPA: hypothetical protein VFR23_24475 [Jiangellaceae bacterium]|nr:hypothetical protein [Jiangellaceae bacterium]